jgi:hypothetical protein
MTRLLAEDLLLLCWDDSRGRPGGTQQRSLAAGLCGALLFDAVGAGVVVVEGRRVRPTGSPAGDPLLAALVAEVGAGRRPPQLRSVFEGEAASGLPTAAMQRLAERGVFRLETRRILGIFPSPRFWVDQADEVDAVRGAVTAVLTGQHHPAGVAGRTLLLAALARPTRAIALLVPRPQRRGARRVAAALGRGDGLPSAVGALDVGTVRAVMGEVDAMVARSAESSSGPSDG